MLLKWRTLIYPLLSTKWVLYNPSTLLNRFWKPIYYVIRPHMTLITRNKGFSPNTYSSVACTKNKNQIYSRVIEKNINLRINFFLASGVIGCTLLVTWCLFHYFKIFLWNSKTWWGTYSFCIVVSAKIIDELHIC